MYPRLTHVRQNLQHASVGLHQQGRHLAYLPFAYICSCPWLYPWNVHCCYHYGCVHGITSHAHASKESLQRRNIFASGCCRQSNRLPLIGKGASIQMVRLSIYQISALDAVTCLPCHGGRQRRLQHCAGCMHDGQVSQTPVCKVTLSNPRTKPHVCYLKLGHMMLGCVHVDFIHAGAPVNWQLCVFAVLCHTCCQRCMLWPDHMCLPLCVDGS